MWKRRTSTGVSVTLNMIIMAMIVVVTMMMMTIIMTLTMIVTFGEERLTEFIYIHQHKRQL